MTAQELIDELSGLNPEDEVYFTYDYGDHCHSKVACLVESVENGSVVFSGYHNMMKLADLENESEQGKEKNVIVLS
jgi:hypothetical protein